MRRQRRKPVHRQAGPHFRSMYTLSALGDPHAGVHVPGDNRAVQLQRAAMPSAVDTGPVRPRTTLLREGLDADQPYFVNEEEVPRVGTRLTLAYNRTRWRGGRPVVWLSIRRGSGRGERSSGLAFDLPTPTNTP